MACLNSGESKGLGHKIPPSLHKAGQSPAGSKQSQREPCLQLHLPVLPIQERGCQLYETKASHLWWQAYHKAFSQLEGVSPSAVWCVLTTPSNPLENAKEWCQTSVNWRKIWKLRREKWETLVAWAAPAQLKVLLLRSVDRTSVWWHPLTAFSITMALSHPCPSSLSQLNEPFPRQIKTGESAFARGRRLRKAIQTGMMGD